MTGVGWRLAGRRSWGGLPFVLAVLVAARHAGRSDWPSGGGLVATGVLLALLAAIGTVRFLDDPVVGWGWVAIGALISTGGVWAGVPETGPAWLVAGGLSGLAVASVLTRSRWAPSAGVGIAAVMGWAALSGAAGRPWAAMGGALCAGVAPWMALRPLLPSSWGRKPGPWLLGAHAGMVVIAARWIGVVPEAGWVRVAAVATAGVGVAATVRRRA